MASTPLGARGYLWREAEEAEHARVDFVDDAIRESIATSRQEGDDRRPDEARGWTLFHGAARCVEDEVPVWSGCPGGQLYGEDFYVAALDQVRSDFGEHGFEISENDQRLAFRFGICLRDVERVLGEASTSTPS